jgi:hypothetical protein
MSKLLLIGLVMSSMMLLGVQSQCTSITDPTDSSKKYDLSPLSSSTDYIAVNTRYPSYSFSINVCRAISGVDATCSGNTGICEKSSFSSSKIGEFTTTFTVVSPGNLQMVYSTGKSWLLLLIIDY